MSDQRMDSLLAFLFGAAVGAGVALLLAPASGEETRKKIGETARRAKLDVADRLTSTKDDLVHRAEDVRSAVSAGREAYQRARTSGEPAPTSNAM